MVLSVLGGDIKVTTRSVRVIGCLLAATLVLRTAAAQDAFEIASVKAADPVHYPIMGFRAYPGGRVGVTNYTLTMLIVVAYGVSEYSITGGPAWVSSDLYNITAKPPAGSAAAEFMPPKAKAYSFPFPGLPGADELLAMTRSLLADRFSLKVHRETRQLPVFALTVGKRSPKLEPSHGASGDFVEGSGNDKNEWRNITMARLIALLEARYRRRILDRTGLTGAYDFQLSYNRALRDTLDDAAFPADPAEISFKTALETQLGLRLEETKGAVETLVIDQAERPSAN
jgi:uncharacterized protein (TIGR03435 family)